MRSQLKQTMRALTGRRPAPRYKGSLDVLRHDRIIGWAINPVAFPASARLAVLKDGQPIRLFNAELRRPDVKEAGHQTDACGFDMAVDLSPRDVANGHIEVAFWENEQPTYRLTSKGAVPASASRARPAGRDPMAILYPERSGRFPKSSVLVEGPLKGEYSIAIVNRSFASSLLQLGQDVTIASGEPDLASDRYLKAEPALQAILAAGPESFAGEVHTLNTWPPETGHMKAKVNALHCYAWEESVFPPRFVDQFNADLKLIGVTSDYTKIALENSGVTVPIVVTGNGVDAALSRTPRTKVRRSEVFNFLHVSSCFPRKGADVLLQAFWEEFGNDPTVSLTIKTFDNPHNEIMSLLREATGGKAKTIDVICADLDSEALFGLYERADCLVAPSRGEGYLLPAAEAMALGVPVVTTDAGGQADFCDDTTAWLVESRVARAQTHMNLPDSYWFEPDVASLRRQMRAVRDGEPQLVETRTRAARQRIAEIYTWAKVGRRFLSALTDMAENAGSPGGRPRLAIVTTWNQTCGIATYSQQLAKELRHFFDITILTERVQPISEDEDNVSRLWTRSSDGVEAIRTAVAGGRFDAILVQHHPSHFSWAHLGSLIEGVSKVPGAPRMFVQLHSTSRQTAMLLEQTAPFARLGALFAHTFDDVVNLDDVVKHARVALVPHGIHVPAEATLRAAAARRTGSRRGFKLASFGFCMPHKGIITHLRAISLLRDRIPGLTATLLHAVTDEDKTIDYALRVTAALRELRLEDIVEIDFSFLDREAVLERLADSDLIVLPYRQNMESASGAAREVAGLGVPILCTPALTFADIESFAFQAAGFSDLDLADAIHRVASDPDMLRSGAGLQEAYIQRHSWSAAAAKIANVITADLRGRALRAKRT